MGRSAPARGMGLTFVDIEIVPDSFASVTSVTRSLGELASCLVMEFELGAIRLVIDPQRK